MQNIIIRRSKINPLLVLSCNQEYVYSIYLDGKLKLNDLDYNIVSDYYNELENVESEK